MSAWQRGLTVLGISLLVSSVVALALTPGALLVGGVPLPWLLLGLAFAINLGAWVPASLAQDERNFDITGTWTFVTVTVAAVGAMAATGTLDLRRVLVALLVLTWTGRLGDMLFRRVHRDGGDGRFDELKTHPGRFLTPWALQATWVMLTSAAAIAVWSRAQAGPPLGLVDLVGLAVWSTGFGIEVVADQQKHDFRANPQNRGRFITTGLWAWSRHPNYFGEIVLWVGVFLIAAPALSGWAWAAALSPVFVAFLLTRVSGVPLLEQRADTRWGEDPDYQRYKARTPVLVPRPPRG